MAASSALHVRLCSVMLVANMTTFHIYRTLYNLYTIYTVHISSATLLFNFFFILFTFSQYFPLFYNIFFFRIGLVEKLIFCIVYILLL